MTVDASLRVLERAVYRGPHLYSHRRMVRVRLDLGELENWPTDRLPGFTQALTERLPGLARHHCSLGRPGGFLERLTDGTWPGHVIEHVALELQSMAGAAVTRGKTRSVRGRPGVYDVLYAYEDADAALLAGRLAVELVLRLLPEPLRAVEGLDRLALAVAWDGDVDKAVDAVRAALRRAAFGPSTAALVAAARRRGIPVERLNAHSLIQLGWGARQRRLRATVTDRTGLVAAESAGDKSETKALLAAIGVPVARGEVVTTADQAVAAAARLKRPWVVKPLDGNHGRGVSTGLGDEAALRAAFDLAAAHGRRILVEEHLRGRDHRILVVDGKVVAVAERVLPQVVGDGRRTIRELVETLNADPRRGVGHEAVMTRVRLDAATAEVLARQGLDFESRPPAGQTVLLRTNGNLSSGGVAIDRTDEIHPDNAALARRAALAVGLDVAGIDLMAPDIRRSIRETGGGVVEVNAAPGLRMHLAPSEGQARDVAAPILDMMYPRGSRARIPVLAITGTNGKSTVGRMVAHVFKAQGRVVGLTNTSGIYVGDERVAVGDSSGPKSARMILRDPTVEVAVLECARGGILREGLAFDRCDVGAVLNVTPDHLGLKGIDTLEDLAKVKSVVAESVGRRGVCVLNADDSHTIRMARHAGGRVCWFSLRGGADAPGFVLKHVAEGGMAVLHDPTTDWVTLHDAGAQHPLFQAAEVPATFGGLARFNIQNAMAAAAMAFGAGVPHDAIGPALSRFTSDFAQNPGRMNVHDAHGFCVILDYAHNPDALRALGDMVARSKPAGARSIAMVSIPGDRRDDEIRAMGEIGAENFDVLVFRETPDNRGRPAGEVIRLMREGAEAAGCDPSRLHCLREEDDAAIRAMTLAQPGDVVVLLPTRIDEVWRLVLDHRPQGPFRDPLEPLLEPAHG